MCGVSTSLRFPGQLNGSVFLAVFAYRVPDMMKLQRPQETGNEPHPFPSCKLGTECGMNGYSYSLHLYYLATLFDAQLCPFLWSQCEAFWEKLCIWVNKSVGLILDFLFSLISISQQTVRPQEPTRRMQPYLWVSLIRSQDPQAEPSSQSLPHSGYDFPWWYLFSRSKCLGELHQRTWWHSFFFI